MIASSKWSINVQLMQMFHISKYFFFKKSLSKVYSQNPSHVPPYKNIFKNLKMGLVGPNIATEKFHMKHLKLHIQYNYSFLDRKSSKSSQTDHYRIFQKFITHFLKACTQLCTIFLTWEFSSSLTKFWLSNFLSSFRFFSGRRKILTKPTSVRHNSVK